MGKSYLDRDAFKPQPNLTLEEHKALGKGKIGDKEVGFLGDNRANGHFMALVVFNERTPINKRKKFERDKC